MRSTGARSSDEPGTDGLSRIGEAATRAGVSERTLRYYEELGLLSPAAHAKGGNRRYGEAEIARVGRIRELQELVGMNLDEIRTILAAEDHLDSVREAFRRTDDPAERRALLDEGLPVIVALRERVAAQVERMTAYLSEIDVRIDRYGRAYAGLVPDEHAPSEEAPASSS